MRLQPNCIYRISCYGFVETELESSSAYMSFMKEEDNEDRYVCLSPLWFYSQHFITYRIGFFEFIHKVDQNNAHKKYYVKCWGRGAKRCFIIHKTNKNYKDTDHQYMRMIIQYVGTC